MTLEKVHLSLLNIIVVKETFKTIIAVKKILERFYPSLLTWRLPSNLRDH